MRLLIAVLLLCPLAAFGQELQFTAETTTGNGEVVPVLTWETSPAADSCVADGAWSGDKGPVGSESLPAIVSSATYSLTCTWASDGDVALAWDNPTERTDGTPYEDKGWTVIEYSPDGGDPWFMEVVQDPDAESYLMTDLNPGDWTFRAYAVDVDERMSAPSDSVVHTVESASDTDESITITVNPIPLAPTGLTVE